MTRELKITEKGSIADNSTGISGMFYDILTYLKFALSTWFGLSITMLCIFIYLFSLYITGTTKTVGLILSILAFVGFVVFSWLNWFSSSGKESNDVANNE